MLGQILDKEARFAEARQAYVMAGLSGQSAGLAENNLGQSFLAEGNLIKALEHFQKAVELNSHREKFDNNRRRVLLLQEEYSLALKNIQSDRATQILLDAGVIAMRKDDRKLATFLLSKAQMLSPIYDARLEALLRQASQRG